MVDAAEQAQQVERVDPAAPGDAVLAVGREDVVLRSQRAAGADLGGLLAEQLGPDAELAVSLQGGRLGVDAAGQHHVAVEPAQLVTGEVEVELLVVGALPLGGQQLHQVGAAVALRGTEHLDEIGPEGSTGLAHASLLSGLGRPGITGPAPWSPVPGVARRTTQQCGAPGAGHVVVVGRV